MMTNLLDLHLLPYAKSAGEELPGLFSVYSAEAPRRSARGREKDRIILYFVMEGNAILAPAKQNQLLETLTKLYYKAPGSVTSAMRTVADELNKFLLERNRRLSSRGQQAVGEMAMVVYRNQQLYLGLCGPMHAFSITSQGVEHFFNPEYRSHALGMNRVTPVEYHQIPVEKDDILILAAHPSEAWGTDFLKSLYGRGPGSLQRHLFRVDDINLNALLVQAKAGQGKIYMPGTTPPAETHQPLTQAAASVTSLNAAAPDEQIASEAASQTEEQVQPPSHPETTKSWMPLPAETSEVASQAPTPQEDTAPDAEPVIVESPLKPSSTVVEDTMQTHPKDTGATSSSSQTAESLAAFGSALAGGLSKAAGGTAAFFRKVFPADLFASIPSTVMAAIAILIPIVIVGIATLTYIRLGSASMFQEYYSQASAMAQQAEQETDVLQKRADWNEAMILLAKAEGIHSNEETQALRSKAQQALDSLELVKRIDYQSALLTGLPYDVKITKMVISNDDMYLLDGESGHVIRAASTSVGFEIDNTFQCGPGVAGAESTGKLIDIIPWPRGYKPDAAILGMDNAGNVLYCAPEEQPIAGKMTPQAHRTIGETTHISISNGNLYVLEPTGNMVWIYNQGDLDSEPNSFFNETMPKLDDVADMTVNNGEELYLLHADGSITYCFYNGLSNSLTRCSELTPVDNRPGREGQTFEPPTPFTQILNTPPPDPSLFLLEGAQKAVYHFSLRNLNYQYQYLPLVPLAPGNATAFAVDMFRRTIYLAVGNQVYLGFVP